MLTTLLLSMLFVPFLTWIFSILMSTFEWSTEKKEPPTAPYWIPYFQHLPFFLWNPNKTFTSLQRQRSGKPFTLLMMNTKFHVFSSPQTAAVVFRRSRDFVFEPVVASMMENGVNLPHEDRPKFQLSLGNSHPLSDEDLTAKEFISKNHNTYLKYLTSHLLDEVMKVYIDSFHNVLKSLVDIDSSEWITVEFHELMRKLIFETSVKTFFGTRLGDIWPTMWEDWKLFNDATFVGVRSNAAFYFQPRARAARERMLVAFEHWVEGTLEDWPEEHGIWNGIWGSRMNHERESLGRSFGFSLRGRACLHASFLFVIITNAAPMATWFTICVCGTPEHLTKYREESMKLLLPQDSRPEGDFRFDMTALKQNQFVQGLWKEALRVGSASSAARVVAKDTELEGYLVKRGSVIMLPVRLMHFQTDIFPDPEQINPERWMIGNEADTETKEKLRVQNASLRSFGGGTGLCSGRFVAEQEIITAVATILLLFDIEFLERREAFTFNPRSIGIMSPAKDVFVRLRRRHVDGMHSSHK